MLKGICTMDITSLIITFVGIIIILALYIISRISRSKLPQAKTTKLPNLKNEDGSRFTSVLDDIPARDGYTPNTPKTVKPSAAEVNETKQTETKPAQQHILFISPDTDNGLDGNLVAKVLKKNGLTLGKMDIYHYLIDHPEQAESSEKISLFRVANGIDPWTLKKEDLHNKELAGLSVVLLTPCEIEDTEAMKYFIAISHKISQEMNGILKNQQQLLFTPKDEALLLGSL